MKPLLSIIVPSYNNADKLDTLLSSIKTQDFKNYEVIVVDGNSQDNTKEVIQRFENLITLFISENDNGIYDAMNKGIKASEGEWLFFIGCDDKFYANDVLKKVFNHEITSSRILYGKIFNKTKQKIEGKAIDSKEELISTSIWHQSVFYRKNVFKQFGEYDTNYKIAADVVFNLGSFSQILKECKFIDIVVTIFSGDGISSYSIDLKYHQNQKKLFKQWFANVDNRLLYNGLQHHLYNQIKIGNYWAALKEYAVLFFKAKDPFNILKNAIYYLKLKIINK